MESNEFFFFFVKDEEKNIEIQILRQVYENGMKMYQISENRWRTFVDDDCEIRWLHKL